MFVAETLGKMVVEIEEEMSLDEFSDWLAWFRLKKERQDVVDRKAKAKSKGRRR